MAAEKKAEFRFFANRIFLKRKNKDLKTSFSDIL